LDAGPLLLSENRQTERFWAAAIRDTSRSVRRALLPAVCIALSLTAAPAAAQPPTPQPGAPTPAPTPAPGTPGGPGSAGGPLLQPPVLGTDIGVKTPGVLFPPLTGLDPLLYPAPAQGPLTLTPSITIAEEFNDNVFSDNQNKRSDFITQISPGLALAMQQPGFTLTASYAVTGEIYAKESQLNDFASSHRFLAGMTYQATPRLGLNVGNGFTYSQYSNAASVSGVSTGRQTSFSNVLSAGLSFQATQRLTWDVSGAYTIQRFDASDDRDGQPRDGAGSQDSDTYQIGTGISYAVTPRLDVIGRYDFQFFNIDGEPSTTHTPRVGASYQFSPTLTASIFAGPSFLVSDGDIEVSPAVSASIAKTTSWGVLSAFYDRSFGTAGGFGGPSDSQTFGGTVAVTKYLRGLFVSFTPRYTMTKNEGTSESKTDVNALSLTLTASYQLARYVALVATYSFFHQTTSGDDQGSSDVDQNRISVGLRFAYPINFY